MVVGAERGGPEAVLSLAGLYEHDLFIVHAEADEPFVCGHLLPALGLDPARVLLSSALALGAPRLTEIERCVRTSRFTIAVLSPAYVADRWTMFGEQLAGHTGDGEARLIPLLRGDCEVPLRLDFRVALDFRDPACWADEARRLRAQLAQPCPAPIAPPCPYPGMRAYSADTAAYFHGREAEVDELLGRLRAGERELYVIGPSGSGKSSLVAAGLVPRLLHRRVSGLGPFVVRTMRPGEHPATRLSEVLEGNGDAPADAVEALLARCAPETSVLIIIDQLEELFVLADEHEHARFLWSLNALRTEPRCTLVFTLRADFYGALMESPLWEALHGRISRIDVAPLRGAALRMAIERPARDVGVYFEPELVERLLGDAATEPGILPLLQETLIQLWDRRQLQLLTLADYQSLGDASRSGLAVAIAHRADAALRALTPVQNAIARRILLRLVSFGEGRSDTRRQQPIAALRAAGDEALDFDAVLRRLVGDRLLTTTADTDHDATHVDLAHEVRITAWPVLATWIRTRRADEQHRRQLEATAALWIERGRSESGLLDPIELAEAEAWTSTGASRELGQSSDMVAFAAASRYNHEKRRKRRRNLVWSAFGALAILAAIILVLALAERRRANEAEISRGRAEDSRRESQRMLALSYQEAGRRLMLDGRLLTALPYLVAARKEGEEGSPLRMLFWTAKHFLPLTQPLQHQHRVQAATFSPDGTRVVTASLDKTARIWDATTGAP